MPLLLYYTYIYTKHYTNFGYSYEQSLNNLTTKVHYATSYCLSSFLFPSLQTCLYAQNNTSDA